MTHNRDIAKDHAVSSSEIMQAAKDSKLAIVKNDKLTPRKAIEASTPARFEMYCSTAAYSTVGCGTTACGTSVSGDRLRLSFDSTGAAYRLAKILAGHARIREVELTKRSLSIRVDHGFETMPEILRIADGREIQVRSASLDVG